MSDMTVELQSAPFPPPTGTPQCWYWDPFTGGEWLDERWPGYPPNPLVPDDL